MNTFRHVFPAIIAAAVVALGSAGCSERGDTQSSTQPAGKTVPVATDDASVAAALALRESERPLRQMIEGWRAPRTMMVHVGDNPSRLAWMQEAVPAGVTIVAVKDKEEALGTQVAENAHGMGMRIIATRGSSREGPDFVDYVGLADELPALIGQADVVVNVTPLTPQTTGLFDSAMFGRVQKHAYFISVGRGPTTVTDDLIAALKSGTIGGAGLDVTDPEPLPEGHPLFYAPRVMREQLRRFVAGDKIFSMVDLKRGY